MNRSGQPPDLKKYMDKKLQKVDDDYLRVYGMARSLTENKNSTTVFVVVVFGLCSFYLLGVWQRSGFGRGDLIAAVVNEQTKCVVLPNLDFEIHHSASGLPNGTFTSEIKTFEPCDAQYTDYTPCELQKRAMNS